MTQGNRSSLAGLFARMAHWPGGRWLFARIVCWRAPYFGTIAPRFEALEPDRCEITPASAPPSTQPAPRPQSTPAPATRSR
mgnify:CR=1 FL=1